jgi:DNA-binding CsgD family transcriptional regulator
MSRDLRSTQAKELVSDIEELPAEGPSSMWGDRFVEDGEELAFLIFSLPVLPENLTARVSAAESDVIRHVLDGRSNQQIAERRGTSARTVANQLQSLYRRFGVTSRLELVRHLMLWRGT